MLIVVVVTISFAIWHCNGQSWLEQFSRQELLIDRCKYVANPHEGKLNMDHILVDHKYQLLYCYVPKVACTNWKRVFMLLNGSANTTKPLQIPGFEAHDLTSIPRLSQLIEQEANSLLHKYTSFLVVRHPFERLLSAYRNKFEDVHSKYFQLRYGKYIIQQYRLNATRNSLHTGCDVTFSEFVQYLLKEGANSNEHWQPIYNLCYPCTINYTFIGHYDTLHEDAAAVLNYVGAPYESFPRTKTANTSLKLRQYFQQLTLTQIGALFKLYKYDFQLFGYSLEDILGFDLA